MPDFPRKILVVDDEPNILKALKAYLEKDGYRVITAADGIKALAAFGSESPDLMVLDLNLPGKDGFEVCREVRKTSDIPILMLTARVEETDKLIGLEIGADDYVIKPFSPREVVARVKVILRRSAAPPPKEDLVRCGDLEIDLQRHAVQYLGNSVELTPTEFDILVVLARQPRRVFSRLQIMELAQGDAFEGYERTIDAHIKNLRLKLESDPKHPVLIQTVFGVGYKLEPGPYA
jgi:two-component system alkaline phosphatase synthesis response regulator PhoP